MEAHSKNVPTGPNDNDPEQFTDKVTRDKIDHHLHDINDTISEQDIKNIITDISSSPAVPENLPHAQEPLPDEKNDRSTDDTADELPTTWNVLK